MEIFKQSINEYLDALSSNAPTPGGGSASALTGALGVACALMYGNLSIGKKAYKELDEDVRSIFEENMKALESIKQFFLVGMERDAMIYQKVMDAFKTDKADPKRIELIQNAYIKATEEPLLICEKGLDALHAIEFMIPYGNKNVVADALTGSTMIYNMILCESYNILSNTSQITNIDKQKEFYQKMNMIMGDANEVINNIHQVMNNES